MVMDASAYQLEAALLQVYLDVEQKPAGCGSHSLNFHTNNYLEAVKECLAVAWTIQVLRFCTKGTHSTVWSSQGLLQLLMKNSGLNGRLMSCRMRFSGFDIDAK